MKIITILGARPQFIKSSVVSKKFKEYGIQELVVHTGQHFDKNMSDVFFDEMGIDKPKYNLNIHGMSHGAMTGQMLEKLEEILLNEKPDYVLVYGDTNSTLAGALAASKIQIPVIHIEAGLRSFNMKMPEEINRILTDRISSILFCPTDDALKNLKNEGLNNSNTQIVKCGDVMEDSAIMFKELALKKPSILNQLYLTPDEYILATIHRAENTDDPLKLKSILDGLNHINNNIPIVLPLHPRTAKIIKSLEIKSNLKIIDPIGYLDMTILSSNAKLIMTDSGGLQKEAFFFNKYCITLREETEWIELVENGYNFLAGSDAEKIKETFNFLKNKKFSKQHNFYGGGNAAQKIADYLLNKG